MFTSFSLTTNGIFIIFAAVILASWRFLYMHFSGRVDLKHSMPVSARGRFYRCYLPGAVVFLVFLMACAVFDIRYAGLYLLSALLFLTAYNITIYAITLTGNPVIAAMVTAILFFYINLWERVYVLMCSYETASDFFAAGRLDISFWDIYTARSSADFVPRLIKLIIWAVVTFFLCQKGYLKRPAEASESLLAFYSSHLLLKLMIVVPVSLVMGRSVYESFSGHRYAARIIGMIITAICVSALIELLFSRSLSAAFKRWGSIFVALAMVFIVYAAFGFSRRQYNSYVPSGDDLESYAVYDPLDSYYYYNNIDFEPDGTPVGYIPAAEYVRSNMFLTDTEAVVTLAMRSQIQDYHSMSSPLPLQIYYRLNGGLTRSRLIWVDMDADENRPLLNRIVGPAYYKEGIWQAFSMYAPDSAKVSAVRYFDLEKDIYVDIGSGTDTADTVVDEWREAMTFYDYDHVRYDIAVGEIEILFGDGTYRWILPVYDDMLSNISKLEYN